MSGPRARCEDHFFFMIQCVCLCRGALLITWCLPTGLTADQARAFVNNGKYGRWTQGVIDGPRIVGNRNHREPPPISFLLGPIILNAIGPPQWATGFVPDLPSQEELTADGAPEGLVLEHLVAAVKRIIWGDGPDTVPLCEKDILRKRGNVYFSRHFQNKLIERLERDEESSYAEVMIWIQTRFNARIEPVHLPIALWHFLTTQQTNSCCYGVMHALMHPIGSSALCSAHVDTASTRN